jgi:hypothetical protein
MVYHVYYRLGDPRGTRGMPPAHHSPVKLTHSTVYLATRSSPLVCVHFHTREAVQEKVQKCSKQGKNALFQDVGQLRQETSMEAFEQGFLEGSQPWKGRFRASPS